MLRIVNSRSANLFVRRRNKRQFLDSRRQLDVQVFNAPLQIAFLVQPRSSILRQHVFVLLAISGNRLTRSLEFLAKILGVTFELFVQLDQVPLAANVCIVLGLDALQSGS